MLEQVEQAFLKDHPTTDRWTGAELVPISRDLLGDSATDVEILLSAMILVLMLTCTNAAGLLLARFAKRQDEASLRLVLGATPWRLIGQIGTECALLSCAGLVVGLVLSWIGRSTIAGIVPADFAELSNQTMDLRVLLFALLLATTVSFLIGVAPAWTISRSRLHAALRRGGGQYSTVSVTRLRRILVSAQVAMATLLLVGSGLMLKGLMRLVHVDPGFRVKNVLVFDLSLPQPAYSSPDRVRRFYRDLSAAITETPGVLSTGAISVLPFAGGSFGLPVERSDEPTLSKDDRPKAELFEATSDYFSTLGIPVLNGRPFTDKDRADAPAVAILSRSLATRLWTQGDPLGGQIKLPGNSMGFTVVGIVGDVKTRSLDTPFPWQGQLYLSGEQMPSPFLTFLVRSNNSRSQIETALQQVVKEADPSVAIFNFRTMSEVLSASISTRKAGTVLIALGGGLAFLIEVVGVYAMSDQSARHRDKEIGVRMALGATKRNILRLILVEGLVVAAVGVLLGVIVSLVAERLLSHLLYNVSATDPFVFATAPLTLLSVALLACYFPARRAATVDPMIILRHE